MSDVEAGWLLQLQVAMLLCDGSVFFELLCLFCYCSDEWVKNAVWNRDFTEAHIIKGGTDYS